MLDVVRIDAMLDADNGSSRQWLVVASSGSSRAVSAYQELITSYPYHDEAQFAIWSAVGGDSIPLHFVPVLAGK
jgi:hypothetical protein